MVVCAAAVMFVGMIGQQKCAAEIHQQPDAGDADRFVEMNFQRNKQPVHGFARHQDKRRSQSTTALVNPPSTPIFPVPKLNRALPACVLAK